MIATLPFLEKRFETFNHACFGGALPPVPLKLSRAVRSLGSCTYKKRRHLFGKMEFYDFCIHVSTRFDLPEEELEDILLHEMIHYEILVNQRQDTSAHGRLFRARMVEINQAYGRHISVSHRHAMPPIVPAGGAGQDAGPSTVKPQVVARVQMKDGRIGVKRLPADARRIRAYRRGLLRSGEIEAVDVLWSDDPYFLRFPKSSAMNVFFPKDPDFLVHFATARPLSE